MTAGVLAKEQSDVFLVGWYSYFPRSVTRADHLAQFGGSPLGKCLVHDQLAKVRVMNSTTVSICIASTKLLHHCPSAFSCIAIQFTEGVLSWFLYYLWISLYIGLRTEAWVGSARTAITISFRLQQGSRTPIAGLNNAKSLFVAFLGLWIAPSPVLDDTSIGLSLRLKLHEISSQFVIPCSF